MGGEEREDVMDGGRKGEREKRERRKKEKRKRERRKREERKGTQMEQMGKNGRQ